MHLLESLRDGLHAARPVAHPAIPGRPGAVFAAMKHASEAAPTVAWSKIVVIRDRFFLGGGWRAFIS
jgi:hypothetical protein